MIDLPGKIPALQCLDLFNPFVSGIQRKLYVLVGRESLTAGFLLCFVPGKVFILFSPLSNQHKLQRQHPMLGKQRGQRGFLPENTRQGMRSYFE